MHEPVLISSNASEETTDIPPSAALAGMIQLARLSRLTLLYHGPHAWIDDAGRERAAAIAAAAAGGDEVVVVYDAGSDMPVPDLLADIEAAVLKAAPDAPLAPPMAGPVEALAFWQDALGLRYLLIFHRFDIALSKPDPEFDQALLRLVRDPLELSLLLVMDESAAPLLHRLRAEVPDLGEAYLRMPEPLAAQEELVPVLSTPPEPPPPLPLQMPPAIPDDATPEEAYGPQAQQRRSREFSSLLEQASTTYDEVDTVTGDLATQPAVATPALPDGKPEPWLAVAATAAAPPPVRAYRDRLPLQVPAWMHKRLGRRRRATLAIAAATGRSSTIVFIALLVLALLFWQMPLAPL